MLKKWSGSSIKRLEFLCKHGWDYKRLADFFGVSESSIRGQVKSNNIYYKGGKDFKEDNNIKKSDYSKAKYRTPVKWDVANRLLYGLLKADDIKLSELATMIDVSPRTVQRWVYEGNKPNEENREKVANVLNIPKGLLFSDLAYSKSKFKKLKQKSKKAGW